MERIFRALIRHKAIVVTVFAIAVIVCAVLQSQVRVNYNFADYLPADSKSTIAIDLMQEEFDEGIPNARIMLEGVTIPEALAAKRKLAELDGITDVMWLDDAVDIRQPFALLDPKIVESYYRDGNALFTLTIGDGKQLDAVAALEGAYPDGILSGPAVNTAVATVTTNEEISRIMLLIVPMCFVILLLTTNSWFEPVLFMVTIGVAIVLNMGTNLIFGEISFVTNAAGSILQLAVSMDYSIFLLHRFADFRKQGMDVNSAMMAAIKKSFPSIAASGLTTMIGFASLILMRFRIGPDMGLVMAKAIVMSMISVLLLLPVLAMLCYRAIDKTRHRRLLPSFQKFGNAVDRIKIVPVVIFAVLLLPCYLASGQNSFLYGASEIFSEGTPVYEQSKQIESVFGKSNQMVLLVPRGEIASEVALSKSIREIPQITSIVSYVDMVGAEIPPEYLDASITRRLMSEHYSRMVLSVDTDYEGAEAFGVVEQVRSIAQDLYGDEYYLAGDSVNTYDMKDVTTKDMVLVNALAILAIFVVLLLMTKSVTLPFILVLVIEASIWMNLTIPYFTGEKMFYIGYLIISTIQLGATVDYAILLANRYLEERAEYDKKEALRKTMHHATLSILTSASILSLGGFLLGIVCTNGVISKLGFLVGRGALFSTLLVLFVLPGLLSLLDRLIQKTTLGLKFKPKEGEKVK